MGKILDTITVLFRGDTEDLKRKKKEAEDIAAETAKNIKDIQVATTATNTTLDTTNKTLTQTEALTSNIGDGLAAWIVAAQAASTSINDAISSEKAHREQIRIQKGLSSTKKGANAVEDALKGIVKEFATAALGALTVGEAISKFKDLVVGTLDLQRAAFSLNLKPSEIDAYGKAAEAAGGSVDEYVKTLENLSNKYNGITGPALQKIALAQFEAIRTRPRIQAESLGRNLGFPESIIRAARRGLFSEENVSNIKKIDSGVDEATIKVGNLNEAWTKFAINVRGTFIDFENRVLGPLTTLLNLINAAYEVGSTSPHSTQQYFLAAQNTFSAPNTSIPLSHKSNFPLTPNITNTGTNTHIVVNELNVQAPQGGDPKDFARTIYAQLDSLQSQTAGLIHYYDNSKVG